MPDYRVFWQIDVHAESARDAVEHAAAILSMLDLDDECSATVFDVYERCADAVRRTGLRIDLSNEPEHRPIRLRLDTLP